MSHRRSTVKGSLSFANPTVRAWLFQILAVVAVVGIVGWLFHNTVTNLNNRGEPPRESWRLNFLRKR